MNKLRRNEIGLLLVLSWLTDSSGVETLHSRVAWSRPVELVDRLRSGPPRSECERPGFALNRHWKKGSVSEMAEIATGLLKLTVILFSLALLPIALVVSTPFVLFWPLPSGDESWGTTVRRRYWRITKVVFVVLDAVNALTGG